MFSCGRAPRTEEVYRGKPEDAPGLQPPPGAAPGTKEIVVSESQTENPNARTYRLRWNDGAPYVHPRDHRTEFALDEPMRIAGFEPVTVIDAETGHVLWVGSEATRGG